MTPIPTITSHLPHILWPAVPGPAGAQLLALLFQLQDSQWWPAEKLEAWQFRQLHGLLTHARETIPFYRDRLKAADFSPDLPLEREQWQRLPVLTRSEVQAAGEALFCPRPPDAHLPLHRIRTSGSTGKPVTVQGTAATRLFWSAFTLRDHLWQRRDFMGKLAAIRVVRDPAQRGGGRQASWGPPVSAVFASGPSSLLEITTPLTTQADWLVREAPAYLLTHPTNALALAEHFLARGLSLPSLRQVRTLAESLPGNLREVCRAAWGAEVVDAYSTQEAGYLALQCPEHPHYHAQSEGVLLEVLADDGRPCQPGEVGRVVVTSLHNFAAPLIRYEVGDYAEAGEPCACGRGLPVLTRILGRVRNMVRLPGGERLWPSVPGPELREKFSVLQYQIIQRKLDLIIARLATARPLTPAEEARVTALLQEKLGYPFRIEFEYPEQIGRSASGKFEEFLSEL